MTVFIGNFSIAAVFFVVNMISTMKVSLDSPGAWQ